MARDRSPITRSGARRLGDDYQDQLALETIVDWLEHSDRYEWIRLEADEVGALDDVVALTATGELRLRQVKYSVHPEQPDDRLTWEMLLEQKSGTSGRPTKSWLQKWATALETVGDDRPVDAALESNRQAADEISAVMQPDGTIDYDRIPVTTQATIQTQLGDEPKARAFFQGFRFHLNRPNLSDLEDGLRRRFYARGGTEMGWHRLKDEVRRWVYFREEPPPAGDISLLEIKRIALWYQLQSLPQEFVIPADYVLPDRSLHEAMVERLSAASHPTTVLYGRPGAGKSTYASALFRDLKEAEVPTIRHHYFLSQSADSINVRLDHQRAAESLMHDLLQDHRQSLGPLVDSNPLPRANDLRNWLTTCGEHYLSNGKALVVIIDGLDHVWRERRSVEELERLFSSLLPVPPGITILFVTQPVDDTQFPRSLLRAAPRASWQRIPLLDRSAILEWLSHHRDDFAHVPPLREDDPRLDECADALFRRSRGHPLHLRYTLRVIQERGVIFSAAAIDALPESPHEDITGYYRELWSALSPPGQDVLHLLASTQFPWPPTGVRDCLQPNGSPNAELAQAMKDVGHLLINDDFGLRAYHSSLIAFIQGLPDHADTATRTKTLALRWLQERAPEYWRWAFAWRLAADLGDDASLLNGPTRDWVVAAIAARRPPEIVQDMLSRATRLALAREDLPRAISIGLLYEYYRRANENDYEATGKLYHAHLLLATRHDERALLRTRINKLPTSLVALLAESESRHGNQAIIEQYIQEVNRRIWGPRRNRDRFSSSDSGNQVEDLLAISALPGGRPVSAIITFAAANRDSGRSAQIVRTFASYLCVHKQVERIRDFLRLEMTSDEGPQGVAALTSAERIAAIPLCLLLAIEEGVNLDDLARAAATEPLAWVYAALRRIDSFVADELLFPNPGFLSEEHYHLREQQEDIAEDFSQAFFGLLACHLRERPAPRLDWIAAIPAHSWVGGFIRHMDLVAEMIANRLRRREPLCLREVFERIADFPFPEFRGNDNREDHGYGVAAGRSLNQLSLDLHVIFSATFGTREIAVEDLQAIFSSGYCYRGVWLDTYAKSRRTYVSANAVDWLLRDLEEELDSTISDFPDRAAHYARAAVLAASHDRQEKAAELVMLTSQNLLAHGNHKDMLLDDVLNAIRFFHETASIPANREEITRPWIRQFAPAIAHADEFTDTDETGHLPRELATVLRVVDPDALPTYYLWLVEIEEYYDADHAYKELVHSLDLTDPVLQAIAGSSVEPECLSILHDRQRLGDENARVILRTMSDYLGTLSVPEPYISRETSEHRSRSSESALPPVADFPPGNFERYVQAVRQAEVLAIDEAVTAWMDHWKSVGRGEAVYQELSGATDRGLPVSCFDELYALGNEVVGREQAYPWLERANVLAHGWDRFFSNEAETLRRWETIKKFFPHRWFSFLRQTIVSDDTPYSRYIGHGTFLRIIRYLLFFGEDELAQRTLKAMVDGAVELVSPLMLETPAWVNGEPTTP